MDITNSFLEFEKKNHLLMDEYEGFFYWQYLRFFIFEEIFSKVNHEEKQENSISEKSKVWLPFFKNLIKKNPLVKREKAEILVLNSPKKIKEKDVYKDIYFDYILDNIDFTYLCLEEINFSYPHIKEKKDDFIIYNDFIELCVRIESKIYLFKNKCNLYIEKIQNLLNELEKIYNVELNKDEILKFSVKSMAKYKKRKKWYKKLLKSIDPKIIIEECYYGPIRMEINEIAKELGINVIELQHGVMGKYHIAYNFLEKRRIHTFPDYIFLFSEVWKKYTRFPIENSKIIVTGFPHLQKKVINKRNNKKIGDKYTILVISQPDIGKNLANFIIEFYKNTKNKVFFECNIIYKFHPVEANNWKREYPQLVKYKNEFKIIVDNTVDIHNLFAMSDCQVGVYSTALFEGLAYQLDTYILDVEKNKYVEELIEENYAKLVKKPQELMENILKDKGNVKKRANFWKSSALENCIENINIIMESKYENISHRR